MKVEEALREEIKEVKAYMTPDGKLYASKDEAVQAYLSESELGPLLGNRNRASALDCYGSIDFLTRGKPVSY